MAGFSLEIPEMDQVKKVVEEETAVEKELIPVISDTSKAKADEILSVDLSCFDDKKEITSAFEEFGADIIKKSSEKNSIMKKRLGELSKSGDEGSIVAKGLEDLSMQMKELDPSAVDFTESGPLAKIFNPVKSYFNKYKSADSAIASIIDSLGKGAQVLKDDNTTLELEQHSLRDLTVQLNKKIALGNELDSYLTAKLNELKAGEPDDETNEKIKFVEEEVLFPLRQRLIDCDQMLAVNQNGIVAMEIIRKNNQELIRSVGRAQTVTVSALTVAVTVAGALYNQKLVLEKVQQLNQATNNIIASTSKMLKEQGTAIHEQAVGTNLDVQTLKDAFKDTLEALDSISEYKQKALPQMRAVIDDFKEFTDEGEKAILRIEKAEEALKIAARDDAAAITDAAENAAEASSADAAGAASESSTGA